jgi:hypothetical protein
MPSRLALMHSIVGPQVKDYARRRVIAARDVDLVRPRRPGIDDEYDFDEEREGEGEGEGEGKGEGGKKKKTWRIDVTCLDVSQDGKLVSVGQSDGGFSVLELGYDDERVTMIRNPKPQNPESATRCYSAGALKGLTHSTTFYAKHPKPSTGDVPHAGQ